VSHAPLMPSASAQWVKCAGSVTLQAGIPEEDSQASMEGTAAHWVCEQVLRSFIKPDAGILTSNDLIGKQAPNGVVIDEEMWDAAKIYVDDILEVCTRHGNMQGLRIEERVNMPEIHDDCWGTPDCGLYVPSANTLYVWDFKYGHGGVSAFENWQMICYTIGLLKKIVKEGDHPLQDYGINVVIRVVQPRCYDGKGSIREWLVPAVNLRGHLTILNQAASSAISVNAICVTGPQCKHCTGAHKCKALRDSTANVIDHSGDAIPAGMTEVALGYELDKLNAAAALIEIRKNALVVDAEYRIRNGSAVPGWNMVQGYGHNKWTDPSTAPAVIKMMTGVDVMAEPEMLTPSKAIALLKKSKVDPAVIAPFYKKPPTSLKLKVDDGSKARQIFSKGAF